MCFIYLVKEEDQSSEPDPDESSYQSSPHAVLETTGSSISTDSDTSGIEWQSLNHNGILCFSCCSYFNFLFFLHIKLSYLFLFKKKRKRERELEHITTEYILQFLYNISIHSHCKQRTKQLNQLPNPMSMPLLTHQIAQQILTQQMLSNSSSQDLKQPEMRLANGEI